jgi:hypothetical protein
LLPQKRVSLSFGRGQSLAFALVKLLSESKQKLRTKEMLPEASVIKS